MSAEKTLELGTSVPVILQKFDRWLLQSYPRVTSPEKILRSRLLSTILIVQALVIVLIIALVLHADPNDINEPTVLGAFLMVGISTGLYILNRFGKTGIAAFTYFLVFVGLFIYIPFYSGENPAFLAFLGVPLIFMAIFFSIKRTLIASIGILVLVGVLLSFMDHSTNNAPYWNLRNMWYFLMLAAVLVLTFMRHLDNMEQVRQSELKRVNQELQQKVAELERFTYTISHELKTPIVTIKTYVGSVEKDMGEKNYIRVEKDLARISAAADKLQDTIYDLLEFSRIGHVITHTEMVDLNHVIYESVQNQKLQIDQNNIQINVLHNLPTIYGDKLRLQEVFDNLIINAIKYMGEQPSPSIEIGIREQDGGRVFFVRDNGIGIDPQYHGRIFNLFEKLNPTIDGTGVGLALVKRIIEYHGGEIWVESEGLGKGSTFCFTILDRQTPTLN